jgi:hypothetical protein
VTQIDKNYKNTIKHDNSTIKYVIFLSRLLNSPNFGKYDTLSSKTCKGEHSTLNGVCARFPGKATIQNKATRIVQRYNKQKGIDLIYVQIKMKLNGLVNVSVNTIAATEFLTSNY